MKYFSLSTIKLALHRVFMKTLSGKETQLSEREYALTSAKLIQQFQHLLRLIHEKIVPAFEDDKKDSGVWNFFHGILGSD